MKYFLLLSVVCPLLSQAQWTQLGQDLDGEAIVELFGSSISMNADGSMVAIGGPGDMIPGVVRIFRRSSTGSWEQVGQDLNGEGNADVWGGAISLSADGSVVAIGAIRNAGNGFESGHVRIYGNISGTWTQIGQDIDGAAAGDRSGTSVRLSADGSLVAIGAPNSDGNGTDSGHVRVFQRNASDIWEQLGQDIDGETEFDQLGIYLSISADGSRVATSSYNTQDRDNAGGVRVFQRESSGNWEQIGQTIYSERITDRAGSVVDLSADGSILAIGNNSNSDNGSLAGHTRVFQRNALGTWDQIGEDLDGETAGSLSGNAVSLSSDGSILAIGGYGNSGNGNAAGHVRVYRNEMGTWERLGEDIDGANESDQSGFSVSLNSNGSIVAIGAPYNSKNGFLSGQAKVYSLCDQADVPTLSASPIAICTSGSTVLTISGNLNGADQWHIYSGSCGGTLVGTTSNNSFPLSPSTTSTYFVRGEGNSCTGDCGSITITVNAANINCPGDVLVQADAGRCSATNVTLGTPNTDGCSTLTVTNDAPVEFPLGETLVTWTVSDTSGNATICTQKVVVEDSGPFTINCPGNVSVQKDAGDCVATNVPLGTPTTINNCMATNVTNDAPTSFPIGETLVTWTMEDASGNTATCVQTVIVEDNEPLTISCPDDVTLQVEEGRCTAFSAGLGVPTVSPYCSLESLTNDSPLELPLGETLVTWTAMDISGRPTSCTQRVLVEDNGPFAITCPDDITVPTSSGSCTAAHITLGTPITDTGCSEVTVTHDAPTEFPLGETLVTWTMEDTSGRTTSCAQKVIVEDYGPFAITCPDDITVQTSIGSCTAAHITLGTPLTETSCSELSVTNDAPVEFPLGETLVTWTMEDASGRTTSCTQKVTVEDHQLPLALARDITINLDTNGHVTLSPEDIDDGSSDNCGIVEMTLDKNSFDCPPLGMETVILTVVDASGNTATDTASITFMAPDRDFDGVADACADTAPIAISPNKGVSPNGDSINDIWFIENIMDYPQAQIQVFDRKGREVFRSRNYQNDWGGTHGTKGSLLPADSYYYAIDVFGDNDTILSGWLYINY